MDRAERRSPMPAPVDSLWAWHVRPGAFERLTPPWEGVRVVEHAASIANGTRSILEVRIGPTGLRWVAEHQDVIPGRQFVDVQREGPFSSWVHTHQMEPAGSAATLIDRIEYTLPMGVVGQAAALWVIAPKLDRMLTYRHTTTAMDLAQHQLYAERPRMRVAISGATGLVGSALAPFLTTGGHRVSALVRRDPGQGEIGWDPQAGRIDAGALEGVDAVVHLAGESIAGARWTRAAKERIRESRIRGTRLVAETVARLKQRPSVLVSASAIGIYGNRGDELLDESSSVGQDFLAGVAREWEAATSPAEDAGIRVVKIRFGVVVSPAGGALKKMLPPFLLGVGGRLGSGRQWMSWIGIDDAVGAIHHALMTPALTGVVNGVAPEPVTNAEFTATLGRVLGRPTIVAVPEAALRLLFGEMADATVLASTRVLPRALLASGYQFRYPGLEGALRHVLGRGDRLT